MFQFVFNSLLKSAEAGQLPDALVRIGIRKLLATRASRVQNTSVEELQSEFEAFLVECSRSPVACLPQKANEQHYEVPAELFQSALGPRLKYSCCQWDHSTETLQQAEVAALQTTCERAELANGQRILELGCGWGSLSLWMAQQYPQATITAVSNSNSQREIHRGTGPTKRFW